MKMHVSMISGLIALLLLKICFWCTEARMQQLEVQQLLKRLNKPAVKSIKSPDGDIIDCVHIYDQPAFDHPLLKNHTIQMRPSSYPSGLYYEKEAASTSSIHQLWQKNGRCPEDTIPIRRTKKEDVLRSGSLERYGKSTGRIPKPASVEPKGFDNHHELAVLRVQGGRYYGAAADVNLWNPKVERDGEFSAAQVLISGGDDGPALNTAQVGWNVFPDLYNDSRTRLYTYWTNDGYQNTGCYNLLCPGFVQTDSSIAVGVAFDPVSIYGGKNFEGNMLIWKDPKNGNWWVQYLHKQPFGYWPSTLFPSLANGSSQVEWGGHVFNLTPDDQHTATGMGSGHFPEEGPGKSAYFRNLQIVDQSNFLRDPQGLEPFASSSNCYSVNDYKDKYFYYGGSGRSATCP